MQSFPPGAVHSDRMTDAPLPSFDLAEAKRQSGGDESILREVMQLFVDEESKRDAEMKGALQRRDAQALERAAHTVKGSCAIFGADPALAAARRLELVARSRDFEGVAEAAAALLKETRRLTDDLRRYLAAPPS
jgi:HPt (histidine-containing phosphotransfer) domain-containing protein